MNKIQKVTTIIGAASAIGVVLLDRYMCRCAERHVHRQETKIRELEYRVDRLQKRNCDLEVRAVAADVAFAVIADRHARRGCPMTRAEREYLNQARRSFKY